MELSQTTVKKIILSNLTDLDPVCIYLEDYKLGQGQLILTCYSSSWTYYWSHMGECTLSEFLLSCNNPYLAGKLMGGQNMTEYDVDATIVEAKKSIIERRRDGFITAEKARDLFNLANDMIEITGHHSDDWYEIFGDEYWENFVKKDSSDYEYLCRILEAMKEGLVNLGSLNQNG